MVIECIIGIRNLIIDWVWDEIAKKNIFKISGFVCYIIDWLKVDSVLNIDCVHTYKHIAP